MKIAGSYQVPVADQERVYRALLDPQVLARCIPGCEGLERLAGTDEYAMKMKMALAAVSGQFAGKVKIADRTPSTSFRLIVEGSGKIGFVKGEGLLTLKPAPSSIDVAYDGEVQIGGTIAAVGQRLVETTSKMMIKRFFDKLTSELGA